jgi:hypothetical protein
MTVVHPVLGASADADRDRLAAWLDGRSEAEMFP